jgi:hypothetical protein
MRSFVKKGLLGVLVAGLSLVVVSDVHAWPFRRRNRVNNGYYTGYNYGARNYTTNGTAPVPAAMPSATVTAPGVGITAGPTGYGPGAVVTAPGVGVNAGGAARAGANLNAPGANPRINAQGTVRGQSPDGPAP